MSEYEHYCEKCGQGCMMFTLEGSCPMCNGKHVRYVMKRPLYCTKIEKLGINELMDN